MLDIKTKAVAETGVLKLTDAKDEPLRDGDGNRCSITLYGPGSTVFQEAEAERSNRISEIAMKRMGKFKLSAEDRRELDATFFARLTISFNHWRHSEAAPGFEAYKAAYLDGEIGFITVQVDPFVREWGNFEKSSPKN